MLTSCKRAPGTTAWVLAALLPALAIPRAGTASASTPSAEAAPPADAGSRPDLPALAGLPLTDALLRLQSLGLRIVFTSQLVRPEMRVAAEPAAREPRLALDEILAPHGLRAEDAAGGTLVVVAAPAARPAEWSITGTVRNQESLEPLAGAVVRVVGRNVETRSDALGRFEVGSLAPGAYTLEAEREDFLLAEMPGVVVGAGAPAVVALTLQPVPFLREEIVVRPSRLSLLDEEPAAPLSLSRDDIEALPHLAGDLFRALSLLPGTAGNDVTAQFHVHGGRRDEVLVLLDGQELYEAYHLHDFDKAVSVVEPGALAGASLSTGAFPASHGDRMSGVLDMTTAVPSAPHRTRLSLSLISAVAASGGSFGGERGTWLASGRRGAIDLASRLLGHEDPAFWDLYGKLGYALGDRSSLRAHLLHAGDSLDFEQDDRGERKLFDTDYDSSYLWATHQAVVGERLLFETTASHSQIDRDRVGLEDEEDQSFEVTDVRETGVSGLGQSWNLQATPGHAVKWGFEARRYETEYDYTSLIEPDLVLVSDLAEPRVGLNRFADSFRGEHLGAYASDRFSPWEPVTVEVGLRYDRHTLTGDTLASPRVNLAWRPRENSVVRASWGHFYQSQRPYELQVEDGATRFSPAERSEHRVLGYERLLGRHERSPLRALRLEAYRREISDPRPRYESIFEPVNVFPEAEPDRVRIAPGSSRSEGVELMLRGAAGRRADWWVNYAWAEARDRIRGRDVPRQIDQTHTVNLFFNTHLARSWDLSLAWRYHTGWPTTPVFTATVEDEEGEPELVPVLGPLNSERLPEYHRLDLRASRDWRLRSGRLVFFLDLQNVYNRKNLAGFDLEVDEDEGTVLAEPEDWPGFFPSVGITWEF